MLFPGGMTGIVTAHDLIEALVGSLPEEGETLQCSYENLQIQINQVEKHRVVEAIVEVMD